METFRRPRVAAFCLILVLVAWSCNMPGLSVSPGEGTDPTSAVVTPVDSPAPAETEAATETVVPSPTTEPPTPTIAVVHVLVPTSSVKGGDLVHDVTSVDSAPEKRAPYGDSYKINLLERPFLQDMTYVSDLDIESFNLNKDEKFYYVSIKLVGTDPNNQIGINYGVEIDKDADGHGDTIITAHPPYSADWTADNVQVAQDTNRDTGGLSPEKSDAPLPGDGYDMVIFDGGRGAEDDPDLAWVRIHAGQNATIQFAFKLALAENRFMLGVIADAGPRNITDLDYVDRFTESEAGSPESNEKNYPLKALFAVDNTCRQAFGFEGTGEEPQRCPKQP